MIEAAIVALAIAVTQPTPAGCRLATHGRPIQAGDPCQPVYRLLIAALTFAASSGETSVMPWSCAA